MEANSAVSDPAAVGFILRLARALHSYGYAAYRLEEVLMATARHFGLTGEFMATPTSLMMAIGPQETQRIHLIRGDPGGVDLGRLARIDAVRSQVMRGALSAADGSTRLDAIERSPRLYSALLTTIAYGLASGAACRFLGGGGREIVVASLIGMVIGILGDFAGRRQWLSLFEPAGAFVAALVAHLVSAWSVPLSVYIATVAGLIILLPGYTTTVAMNELSNRHLVAGTARLMGAFVTFVGIAFGVASGTTVAQLIAGAPQIANATALPGWTLWAALAVAPFAFTVLLRAEPKDAFWILGTGALAFWGGQWGARAVNQEIGAFLGALLVGLLGSAYAHLRDRPSVITVVPGILLLVPGSIGFRSVSSLLDREVIAGVETAFTMVMTVIALVAGLLVANVVAPTRRKI